MFLLSTWDPSETINGLLQLKLELVHDLEAGGDGKVTDVGTDDLKDPKGLGDDIGLKPVLGGGGGKKGKFLKKKKTPNQLCWLTTHVREWIETQNSPSLIFSVIAKTMYERKKKSQTHQN